MESGTGGMILGTLSLFVSIVTLVVLIKGKNNALRENLYNRQLDIFQSVYSKIIDLDSLFHVWLPLVEKYDDDKQPSMEFKKVESELESLESQINITMERMDEELAKAQILIPDEMAETFGKFMETFDKIENMYYAEMLTKLELQNFSLEIHKLEDAIRNFIGLERLSKESRRLI